MKFDSVKAFRGLRIAVPWVLAAVAPLVMAKRNAAVYEQVWDSLPWLTQITVKYGLFLSANIWLAVLIGLVVIAVFQLVAHHRKYADSVKRMFLAMHLSGVLFAMLVIFTFFLPNVVG